MSLEQFLILLMTVFGALGFGYQSFDSIRSALHGIQPKASAPDKDPKNPSTRFGALCWGVMSGGLSLLAFYVFFTDQLPRLFR